MITITNRRGMEYKIEPLEIGTRIHLGPKSIDVPHEMIRVLNAWRDWTVNGSYVQDAFYFFSPDEREFLITGLTSKEWNELFPDEE